MSYLFWIISIAMASFALTFVVIPLTQNRDGLQRVKLAAALLVPILAIGMYTLLGEPSATESSLERSGEPRNSGVGGVTQQSATKVGTVASLVGGLAERLKEEPDDAKAWLLLARSYEHLGRREEAAAAYARASALGESDVSLEASLAKGNRSTGGKAEIHGRVSLAAAVSDQVEPTDTVFVFAKAVNGSSMPVAALRQSAGDLPFDFVLNDRLSMVDIAKLSNFETVVVGARISRSGNAMQDDMGLTVQSDPVKVVNGDFVELQIKPGTISDGSF